jgi:hypothetical protein
MTSRGSGERLARARPHSWQRALPPPPINRGRDQRSPTRARHPAPLRAPHQPAAQPHARYRKYDLTPHPVGRQQTGSGAAARSAVVAALGSVVGPQSVGRVAHRRWPVLDARPTSPRSRVRTNAQPRRHRRCGRLRERASALGRAPPDAPRMWTRPGASTTSPSVITGQAPDAASRPPRIAPLVQRGHNNQRQHRDRRPAAAGVTSPTTPSRPPPQAVPSAPPGQSQTRPAWLPLPLAPARQGGRRSLGRWERPTDRSSSHTGLRCLNWSVT